MQIYRKGSESGAKAPEGTFVGDVTIEGYFTRPLPSQLSGAVVTFAPGSRTPWKVNPFGQTLIVLSGSGRAQTEGDAIVPIGTGDIVWCEPGKAHWEGAAPDAPLVYVAFQEGPVHFERSVTDAEYDA